MLRPQMLEAMFVAGSVFVGITAPAVKWEKLVAVSRREMSFGYELISAAESKLSQRIQEAIALSNSQPEIFRHGLADVR